ncbi:hypothetical protein NIES4073_68310 [Kalymmatonema gypsitolerans NIES-4073]|nr:hypothetical protein NIES4073_68310 [Scytonema sp. NIES-4073]
MPMANGCAVSVSSSKGGTETLSVGGACALRLRPTGEPVKRARETLIRPAGRLRQQDWTHQLPAEGNPPMTHWTH